VQHDVDVDVPFEADSSLSDNTGYDVADCTERTGGGFRTVCSVVGKSS